MYAMEQAKIASKMGMLYKLISFIYCIGNTFQLLLCSWHVLLVEEKLCES